MMNPATYFISYTTRAANDIAWAKWLSWVIENKLGAKTIIQEYDFLPGDNFRMKMDSALRVADAVVCVLTRAYYDSSNCIDEWTNAKRIIPVRFDDSEPPGLLNKRVYIDLYGLDKDSARERLVAKIKGSSRPTDEPDAPFEPAAQQAKEPEFPVAHHTAVDADTDTDADADADATKHNLPPRNMVFTGRVDMLANIHAGLQASSIVAVVGQGGFGKTQASVEYAYRNKSEYSLMWHFNAESEERLQEGYRNFAMRNFDLTENAKDALASADFAKIRRMVDEWFRNNASYLLIYDNAEGCPNLKQYIPLACSEHIIVNSRERVQGIVASRMEAKVFSANDSVKFLHKRISGISDGDALSLAVALGHLPLALECAASYIKENDYTPAQYLKELKVHKLRMLDEHPTATDYEHTVLTVWDKTFEKLSLEAKRDEQTKAALQLFKLCTYCAPEGIPLRMFIDGRDEAPQPLRDVLAPDNVPGHNELVAKLRRYSLVSMERQSNGIWF